MAVRVLLTLSILALVSGASHTVLAQAGTIAGSVTRADTGEPIPGVNVVVEGTQMGAATDADGTYEIPGVEPGTYAVVATFIGYDDGREEGVEVNAGATTVVDLILRQGASGLDEVVVVGYGEQQRRDLTGSVSSISTDAIQSAPVTSVEETLQGRVAGVQVRQSGGGLEGDFDVLVRGIGSTGNTQPLYVVDGVPLFSGALETLSTDDIESIEILKDASATAIYGARASNGVVLITTQSGHVGETEVSFSAEVGMQEATRTIDMMNSQQMADLFIDAFQNAGIPVPPGVKDPEVIQVNNNWQELMLQNAPRMEYDLSIAGGDEETQFTVLGSYANRDGVLIETNLQQISARTNINHQANDRLNVGARLAGSRQWRDGSLNDDPFSSSFRRAIHMRSWVPYKDENGEYAQIPGSSGAFFGIVHNPVAEISEEIRRFKDSRFLGNAFAEYDILDRLQFRISVGADLVFSDSYTYLPVIDLGARTSRDQGRVLTTDRSQINWVADQTLRYNKLLGQKHDIEGLLGFSAQQFIDRGQSIEAFGTTNNNLREVGNQPNVADADGFGNEAGLLSAFARLNYNYDSKYLVTATLRRDGSSRFGSGNRFGTFPSVSVAWRLSEESFLQGLDLLDDLKIRTSYGLTGNQAIGNFEFLARAGSDLYVWGDALAEGNAPVSFANPNLQWESIKQFDLGFDLALFDQRLSITADYYDKVSDNILVNIPLAPSNGISSFRRVNLGSVQNRGVEFAFNSRNLVGDFSWTTNFNVATNANEVLDIGTNARGEPLEVPGRQVRAPFRQSVNLTKSGYPIGAFYGYIFEGVWQLDEAAEAAGFGVEPGDAKFRDLNNDGQISQEDRTFLGQPQPSWYGGVTNTLSYKGVTLSTLVSWQAGHELLNTERMYTESGHPNLNQRTTMLDRWTPDNPSNTYPRATRLGQAFDNARASTRFLEDASFLRVKNIRLSYSIPQKWISALQVKRAEVALISTNTFTFTNYTGFDPESNSVNSPLSAGQDVTPYPLAKTYSIKFNISF